jgi:hypothetical protein
MLRWIVNFVVTSILRVVQNRAVGHITVIELDLLVHLLLCFTFWSIAFSLPFMDMIQLSNLQWTVIFVSLAFPLLCSVFTNVIYTCVIPKYSSLTQSFHFLQNCIWFDTFYAFNRVIINPFIVQFIYFSYLYLHMFVFNTCCEKPAVKLNFEQNRAHIYVYVYVYAILYRIWYMFIIIRFHIVKTTGQMCV